MLVRWARIIRVHTSKIDFLNWLHCWWKYRRWCRRICSNKWRTMFPWRETPSNKVLEWIFAWILPSSRLDWRRLADGSVYQPRDTFGHYRRRSSRKSLLEELGKFVSVPSCELRTPSTELRCQYVRTRSRCHRAGIGPRTDTSSDRAVPRDCWHCVGLES